MISQPAKSIRVAGRNTQGVRLIRLDDRDKIAAVAVVPSEEEKAAKDPNAVADEGVPATAGRQEAMFKEEKPAKSAVKAAPVKPEKIEKGKTKKGKKR